MCLKRVSATGTARAASDVVPLAETTSSSLVIVTVPGVVVADGGILADVAPTVLGMLAIDKPAAMTGRSLVAAA